MMIHNATVNIMWKEIGIGFILLYLARVSVDIYIKNVYEKISAKFYSNDWNGLEIKIKRHRKLCAIFSGGPRNRNVRMMYNGLCVALASIALIENNEEEFIRQLDAVKKETEFEMKPFMLALYFKSKHDELTAKECYDKYLQCNRNDEDIRVIMEYFFCQSEEQKSEELELAIKKFQNPATMQLLRKNFTNHNSNCYFKME